MIHCRPGPTVRLKRAARSGVVSPSATKLKSTVFGCREKFVTVSSLENSPVSTITGRVLRAAPANGPAVTGKTKEPSELPLSLMTP